MGFLGEGWVVDISLSSTCSTLALHSNIAPVKLWRRNTLEYHPPPTTHPPAHSIPSTFPCRHCLFLEHDSSAQARFLQNHPMHETDDDGTALRGDDRIPDPVCSPRHASMSGQDGCNFLQATSTATALTGRRRRGGQFTTTCVEYLQVEYPCRGPHSQYP